MQDLFNNLVAKRARDVSWRKGFETGCQLGKEQALAEDYVCSVKGAPDPAVYAGVAVKIVKTDIQYSSAVTPLEINGQLTVCHPDFIRTANAKHENRQEEAPVEQTHIESVTMQKGF